MKIGTITFHNVNNYGAVLQAYALQKTIVKLGHDCDVIDYRRSNLRDVLLWQKNKIKGFFSGALDRQSYTNLEFFKMVLTTYRFNNKVVINKFIEFRTNHLQLSRPVNSNTIMDLNSKYDMFISGSDQVWNCGRVTLDKTYFLEFVNECDKKGSYAASFGIKDIPEKYKEVYIELLSKYKYLSVREEAGVEIIEDLINKRAKQVLDPTLLLNKKEWKVLINENEDKNSIVIVYMLEYSEKLMEFANELAMKTNSKIVYLNKPIKSSKDEEYRENTGPIEWLEEFYNANYVVTNSFHGVAFSINFNKEFYVEIAEDRIRGAMGSRIENILRLFGLEGRLINKISNLDEIINIDYDNINNRLEMLREDSLKYLETMLRY